MAALRRHATALPGRWPEPGALPAADHTARHAHQERGRRRRRRRVSGQCGGSRAPGGSVIPHAGAIGALMIAMIEAPFRARAMAPPCHLQAGPAPRRPAPRRAIRVTAVARRANRERPAAPATGLLTERGVHGVGATTSPDWTSRPNHGTQGVTGSGCRSVEAVIEGLECQLQALTSSRRRPSAYQHTARILRGALGGSGPCLQCRPHRRRAPAGLFDEHRLQTTGLDSRPELRAFR